MNAEAVKSSGVLASIPVKERERERERGGGVQGRCQIFRAVLIPGMKLAPSKGCSWQKCGENQGRPQGAAPWGGRDLSSERNKHCICLTSP